MKQGFQIGELAIMQNATFFEEYDDAPAVIVDVLKRRWPMNMKTMENEEQLGYSIKILVENAPLVTATPCQLRKLRDDEQEQALTLSKINRFHKITAESK